VKLYPSIEVLSELIRHGLLQAISNTTLLQRRVYRGSYTNTRRGLWSTGRRGASGYDGATERSPAALAGDCQEFLVRPDRLNVCMSGCAPEYSTQCTTFPNRRKCAQPRAVIPPIGNQAVGDRGFARIERYDPTPWQPLPPQGGELLVHKGVIGVVGIERHRLARLG
jgi:hypothetical protein